MAVTPHGSVPASLLQLRPDDGTLELLCVMCGSAWPWADMTPVATAEGRLPVCPRCISP